MIEIFNSAIDSPSVIIVTIFYVISESIAIYDTRLIQWKKHGMIPKNTPTPPAWSAIFGVLGWLLFIGLILLNWKYGIIVILVVWVLKVLPVLETIGKILMTPFITKK